MKKVLQYLACLLLFVSCKTITSTNYLCFDEVKYITQFPKTVQLGPGEQIELNLIGVKDMLIHDSLMIVGTSNSRGYWSFFSLPGLDHKGNFLLQGNGPQEFLFPPSAGKAQFRSEDGKTVIYIPDTDKRRIMRMDISETLQGNDLKIANVCDSLPPLLFNLVYIDSTTYLCKTITKDQAQQIRFMLRDGHREKPEFLKKSFGFFILRTYKQCVLHILSGKTDVRRRKDERKNGASGSVGRSVAAGNLVGGNRNPAQRTVCGRIGRKSGRTICQENRKQPDQTVRRDSRRGSLCGTHL